MKPTRETYITVNCLYPGLVQLICEMCQEEISHFLDPRCFAQFEEELLTRQEIIGIAPLQKDGELNGHSRETSEILNDEFKYFVTHDNRNDSYYKGTGVLHTIFKTY